MVSNRHLACPILDGRFHEFRRQFGYKATMHGATVTVADRWSPPSNILFSARGSVAAGPDLSQHLWRCASCGLKIDGDLNAATNLEGLTASSAVTACGGPRCRATPPVRGPEPVA